jgi:type II secretory pathway predicted ATPase ExeA
MIDSGPALNRPVYLEHFNLREAPFTLTPNTGFFYSGGDRGSILDALEYASLNTEGVITMTGEVGTGKTMLSRMLIERKPRNLEVVYIANPALTRDEIIHVIASELRMRNLDTLKPVQILKNLQKRLIDLHSRGKRVLLLIDEAHVMSAQTLEEIRLLSNLETNRHKLLRIMLVGQDELNRVLSTSQMRPLRERITERFPLGALSVSDVAHYLSYRLRKAGGNPNLFDAKAAVVLAKASGGISRRVNILAEKALLAAFSAGAESVGMNHVVAAIQEARFTRLRGERLVWWDPRTWSLRFLSRWIDRVRDDSRSPLQNIHALSVTSKHEPAGIGT